MRKLLVTLGCAWVLWVLPGRVDVAPSYLMVFETLAACQDHVREVKAMSRQYGLQYDGKNLRCLPSDMDPEKAR